MSICIPGMGLPSGCTECPLYDWDGDYCLLTESSEVDFRDEYETSLKLNKNRLPNCPLKEIEE